MIGLPASGKTTWAEKHCHDQPEKRFTILGTNLIMEKMKVTGLARKQNYHGRWELLIKKSTEVLNAIFLLAGKNLRNYIIDQVGVVCTCGRCDVLIHKLVPKSSDKNGYSLQRFVAIG